MNSPLNACLDENRLRDFKAGRLAGDERQFISDHLGQCARCAALERTIQPSIEGLAEPNINDRLTKFAVPPALSATTGLKQRALSDEDLMIFSKPESPDEIGRLGHYRILRELGRGGMGVVYEAEDMQLHRHVAIKVLRIDGFDADSKQRFLQEARIVASLNDPRIVTIHQIGEQGLYPFIVMELLRGESLETYLDRKQELNVLEAIKIVRDVAQGLRAAHAKALIHRDIKPGNIWLQSGWESDENRSVKLLDFGIARSYSEGTSLTQKGQLIGTPSYMCPERARGLPVDQRSDIFSLGCLFYALLTGASPFERANTLMSLRAAADAELGSFDEKLTDVPPAVRDYIRQLLSKLPADRPQSAEQVCQDLTELEQLVRGQIGTATLHLPSIIGKPVVAREQRLNWIHWVGILILVVSGLIGVSIEFSRMGSAGGKSPPVGAGQDNASTDQRNAAPPGAIVPTPELPPITVGLLLSLSGGMAISERPLLDAFIFAIDEINQAGGVLNGRKLKHVRADGQSVASEFATQAEKLILEDKVSTIFGVWRSSCRIAVEKVCEDNGNLLVYPATYEGLETSPAVIYMGGTANQQVIPSVKWAFAHRNKRKFFLIGTEGLFSRAIHEIIRCEVTELGGQIVSNDFHEHDHPDFSNLADQIRQSGADVILNSLVGSDNIGFFSAIRRAEIKSSVIPIISYNVTEQELSLISSKGSDLDGNYSAWSYFQSLETEANNDFKQRFLTRFPGAIITDPIVAAYSGMRLWALAVEAAQSDDPRKICLAFPNQRFQGPEGLVTVDAATQIARRMSLIGEVTKHLNFEVVSQSPKPIDPDPFPKIGTPPRTPQEWLEFIRATRGEYQEHWSR